MNTKLIEKIQKLLALANSSNENEARLAAEKANELMLRHNIEAQSLNIDLDYSKEVLEDIQVKRSNEAKFIHPLLQDFFFVTLVYSKRWNEKCIFILGEKTNIEIARYVHDFLNSSFKTLWKSYRKENAALERERQGFYLGLYKGLKEQLTARKKSVENEMGLVWVKDTALDSFVRNSFSSRLKTESRSNRVNSGDGTAMAAGFEAGRNLHLRRGIHSTSNNSQTLRLN